MEVVEEKLIWKPESESESMVSITLGRVMRTLLGARPRKLYDGVSRLSPDPKRGSLGSLEESLWFLHKYVKDAAEKEESFDEVLVPMIEHSLKCKELKQCGQAMILLNWLFQDELLFRALAKNLANIILRKEDRYLMLGWCILVRGLVEYDGIMNQYSMNGIKEKYNALLKILSSCISRLSYIVSRGSTLQDGFELPSRLSVAAADCFLALSESLTKKAEVSSNSAKLSNSSTSNRPITLVPVAIGEKKVKPARASLEVSNMEMEYLLWVHLQELINLVQRLLIWSRKSRPLHAKGLEKVLQWLQKIKGHYSRFQDEAGSKMLKSGVLLLSSCWKHYSMLLHLEDQKFSKFYKELLEQYLSGIQFYTDNCTDEHAENKDGGVETRKFFLNCLCLLLGRLDSKKFGSTVSENGLQISRVLLSQLHCADEDVIEGAICIFKAAIFKLNYSSESSLTDTRQMDAVLPLLLNLLDERDGTARAVVVLIADYCSIKMDSQCLQEVLKRLASRNVVRRRNAVDVVSELIRTSSDCENVLSHLAWQDIANHLIERLGDEEIVISEQASNLLPMIDPSLVLPALVRLVYMSDDRVQSSASNAIIGVLKYHGQKPEVICMLLDCLSDISKSIELPKTSKETGGDRELDSDRVLKLIPKWSENVRDWNVLVGPLIDKIFAEPSNATIVRFLSCISEYLAKAANVVLDRVLLHVRGQKEIDRSFFSTCEGRTYTSNDSVNLQQSVFERLCPLLVIRLLPLSVFNDLNSSIMYSQLLNPATLEVEVVSDRRDINIADRGCVAALLLNRAFKKFEFEDVRKLAAELCGRIHPQVLFPIVCSQMEHAVDSEDTLMIKACLFSICTSLVVRGGESIMHPVMLKIRKLLETVLLWPSLDGDEVSKSQHGCIDCLALMICAELQAAKAKDSKKIVENGGAGDAVTRNSILAHVIHRLVQDKNELVYHSKLGGENCAFEASVSLSFRLCMANVLISACQKILDPGKKLLAQKSLPCLILSAEEITDAEVRASCIQVLFSAVYHLKSAVVPYSSDLLKLSLKYLKNGSDKERMAGAKLMVSLMASEDSILESISGGLLEARSVLSNISLTDPSMELRQVCNKLLVCMTSS